MAHPKIEPSGRGASINRLNPMRRMFVEELLADETFNATAAARKAGYKRPSQEAARLLVDPAVRAIIGKALQERITRCRLTADAVLQHLATALFLDPLDLFEKTEGGGYLVRALEDIPIEVRRCITKIKQRSRSIGGRDGEATIETYLEVELMSKDAALVNAMKHLMLINPDQNLNVNVGGLDLKALLDRVENERKVVDGSVIRKIAEG